MKGCTYFLTPSTILILEPLLSFTHRRSAQIDNLHFSKSWLGHQKHRGWPLSRPHWPLWAPCWPFWTLWALWHYKQWVSTPGPAWLVLCIKIFELSFAQHVLLHFWTFWLFRQEYWFKCPKCWSVPLIRLGWISLWISRFLLYKKCMWCSMLGWPGNLLPFLHLHE